ncbi:MAG: hypothetical protein P4L91_17995 [Burkholderiaceae bacterium]|nr:hypothetical protein [Burkholderiaceae bacterium]
MKSDNEIIAAGKERLDYLEIFDLASKIDEDEFGNITYHFVTPVATVVLCDSTNDGDISLELSVPAQKLPLVKLDLAGCKEIHVVNDKRGKYLEFVGQLKSARYLKGGENAIVGFRLQFEPRICLEPYLINEG